MKINLTKKEYRTLLDIIHIADWVMHAHDIEGRSDTKEYEALHQKFYSFAEEMGYDDLVQLSKEDGKFYPTFNFESESVAENLIQEFENNSFWEELTSRLARRDALRENNAEAIAELSDEEWFSTVTVAEEKWVKEFEAFDLDRIVVNQAAKVVKG